MPYPAAVLAFVCCLLTCQFATAQTNPPTPTGDVYVDDQGVMRWRNGDEEVKGFGVNYTVPFAHAYRSATRLGVNPLRAIDQDVYHFARLSFDLYRVHVWDTEISDTLGNLLYNEHLHAFDYLLKKLGERGINYVITPIAYWGNGWPEPDEATPGFSAKYGKDPSLTNPAAIDAQANYLEQFMKHVNPYTGVAYKDDPRLIAVEISNEPHHREAPEKVTAFVRRMVDAIRETGCEKPIFYNISHSVHLVDSYFAADIQGGTFQWYPTGLGYQRELPGNFLPNVDNYLIPFDDRIKHHQGAKLVYEFDAADVGRSYIYPAMARSFREAGIQIATHFSYDPMFLAYANTEYNTHHMNLAYTPQKALSLLICGEVFHRLPMYKDYGSYPQNTSFEGFTVSYERDLATLNVPEKFFYTNTTTTTPVDESQLTHIAGYGSSPVVDYLGTGAYFLDKLDKGVWRLEVMPDAMIVNNPYGRNSLDKTVAVVRWNERPMHLRLQDLGGNFTVTPLNEGNNHQVEVAAGRFSITPGAYLLTRAGVTTQWDKNDRWGVIRLGEFQAPDRGVDQIYVVHEAPTTAIAGAPLTIRAQVIGPDTATSVQLAPQTRGGGWIDMQRTAPFTYEAVIPAERMEKGFLTYHLIVRNGDRAETYPAGQVGMPFQWDFHAREPYRVRVFGQEQPISLFDAQENWDDVSTTWWSRSSAVVPTDRLNEAEYQLKVDRLHRTDNENLNAPVIADYSVRHYVKDDLAPLKERLAGKTTLVLKARSLSGKAEKLQVALVTGDGAAYGKTIDLGREIKEYSIPLSELKKVPMVTMPRPYPTFLPYYFSSEKNKSLSLAEVEGVQFSLGPGVAKADWEKEHGVGIVSLVLK